MRPWDHCRTPEGSCLLSGTKSSGPASCHQPYVREEDFTGQFAEQLKAIELDDDEYAILRDILKQSHADEQRYRDEQLARLHHVKVDLQKKEDALLERLLDETITREVYEAKFTALEQERGTLDAAILGHEQANRSPLRTHRKVPGGR